jgi:uncharacterized membrane protein
MKPQNAGSGLRRRVSYGQSIVLLALALPILTGIISLASDVANYYFSWFKIQRGADSAVLSGAVYLPAYPDLAIATAHTYAQSNGVAASFHLGLGGQYSIEHAGNAHRALLFLAGARAQQRSCEGFRDRPGD